MTLSAGPGYAWYLMIVVAIIAVISAVAILLKKIVPEAASPKTLLRSAHK
jgi:Tfp pilus assembly major pilin PilA